MGRGQAAEHRIHDVERLLRRECSVVLEQIAQSHARQILHDQVGHVGVLALVEDVDHIGMGEACRGPCLLNESFLEVRLVGQMAMHHLDGDATLQTQIGRQIHSGHTAPGNT